jgi:hypothetical protein
MDCMHKDYGRTRSFSNSGQEAKRTAHGIRGFEDCSQAIYND